jgi:2-keto-4-pentenoate hydratase/2-oxohepta-3-ene-1,7-dioic acid hydratase in catechol pathway
LAHRRTHDHAGVLPVMKLARYEAGQGPELGIVTHEGVISVQRALPSAPADLATLIADWSRWQPQLIGVALVQAPNFTLDQIALLAPIPRPGKILGIGLNYADHVAESGMEKPADQLWFSKPATAIAGPNDAIPLPRVSEQLDYEAELVVVIGTTCGRYADEETARKAIFGYCVGNDVSVRDWQFKTSQFILGKSFDGHAPCGPWIVTADEVNAADLDIACRVNGELRQSSNTRNLIFDPVTQIRYLSQVMTLEPGDLLFTGTPGGVGAGFKPPQWLKADDLVEIEIAGVGKLANRVLAD